MTHLDDRPAAPHHGCGRGPGYGYGFIAGPEFPWPGDGRASS